MEVEKTTEELESIVRKEQAKLKRAERYEWRTKEKEEKEGEEDNLEDLLVELTSKSTAEIMQKSTENPGKIKPDKARNPLGKKIKLEMEAAEEIEEEEEDVEVGEMTAKCKIVGCINKEEATVFQEYVQNKMIVLVEKMRIDKNLIQLIRELIRALKL